MGHLHAHFHVTSLSVLKTGGVFNSLFPLNDKDDKNDKETEKSPMRVIGRGLWKPCHCCHSCHGRCGQVTASLAFSIAVARTEVLGVQ